MFCLETPRKGSGLIIMIMLMSSSSSTSSKWVKSLQACFVCVGVGFLRRPARLFSCTNLRMLYYFFSTFYTLYLGLHGLVDVLLSVRCSLPWIANLILYSAFFFCFPRCFCQRSKIFQKFRHHFKILVARRVI
jgi:hypothetical protein